MKFASGQMDLSGATTCVGLGSGFVTGKETVYSRTGQVFERADTFVIRQIRSNLATVCKRRSKYTKNGWKAAHSLLTDAKREPEKVTYEGANQSLWGVKTSRWVRKTRSCTLWCGKARRKQLRSSLFVLRPRLNSDLRWFHWPIWLAKNASKLIISTVGRDRGTNWANNFGWKKKSNQWPSLTCQ